MGGLILIAGYFAPRPPETNPPEPTPLMNSESNFFSLHLPLASAPMFALLSAQFVSALADNVLFILVLALIRETGGNGMIPLVQEFFVFAFILLAPFVGPFADSQPKGRVMLLANGIKLLGAGYILAGGNALVGYAIVGAGAAAYSPAKYGILTQFFDPPNWSRPTAGWKARPSPPSCWAWCWAAFSLTTTCGWPCGWRSGCMAWLRC